jgi:O-antigen/teichoic acid export membrane protein
MKIITLFKSSLIKSIGIYTLTNMFGAAVPFLLLPFFTRWLTPEDYGKVAMFGLFVAFLSPVVGLSINGAIAQKFYDKQQGMYKNARILWSGFVLIFLMLLVCTLIVYIFQTYFIKYLSLSLPVLLLALLSAFISMFFQCYLTLLQVRKKALYYGLLQMLFVLLSTGLSLLFIGYLDFSWLGRIYASFIASFIVSVISFSFIIKRKWIVFKFSKSDIIILWHYGFPLIFHSIGGMLISIIDRFFIANMISLKEAGLYALAYSICGVFGLFTNSFNQAFVPWLFEKLNKNEDSENLKIVKFTYLIMFFLILLALFGTILSPFVLKYFVGQEFYSSQKFFFWLLLGFAFGGMYYLVTNYIFYVGKTKYLAYSTLFTGVLNVWLCYILIEFNGVIGAAQSFAISNFSLFLITWVVASRCHKMPWVYLCDKKIN